ncbi:MAG: DUF2306 domain-containing protein [Sandaracinaceae bacterium]
MDLPLGVLAVYGALAVWAGLLVDALRRRSYALFLGFGIALLLVLNVRYFIEGAPASIAFFIGIYDVLDNLGLSAGESAAAMAACPGNDCSVWGDMFAVHPAWGVAFYDRFLNGPALRTNLLHGHVLFNSLTFVLLHLQLLWPGHGARRAQHRLLGRATFATLTVGVACAVWLASEHGPVGEYGGSLSMWGFYFMSACVYVCAVMGVVAIRRGDHAAHRVWMIRFAGSMWGSFWLFRVMLFVLDPLLRDVEAAAIQTCIWLSAPLGIVLAEVYLRRAAARPDRTVSEAVVGEAPAGG